MGKNKTKKKKKKNKENGLAHRIDRHVLYEESVQDPEFDLDICERLYRKTRGKRFHLFREDFCGTAALACGWVTRNKKNRAWGIDLDKPTLEWGRRHHVPYLGEDSKRVKLVHGDVLTSDTPKVDLIGAFNFSCFVFKERETLKRYFQQAHACLKKDGVFLMDVFGGTGPMEQAKEKRTIPRVKRPDGVKIPKFTYVWDQERYNVIDHHILCHIHFRFADGTKMPKAFTYDWRLWSIPEVRELLEEAGFASSEVYIHGWDEDGESDEVYRARKKYESAIGWIGYVVAAK